MTSARRRSLDERLVQAGVDPQTIEAELRGELPLVERRARLGQTITPRDLEVMVALLEHSSARAAGRLLGISHQTVKNHVGAVMQKLGARSRTHATWLLWPRIECLVSDSIGPPRRDRRAGYQRRRSGGAS